MGELFTNIHREMGVSHHIRFPQFEESQKLQAQLEAAIKQKQTAEVANQELRDRLADLQAKEIQSQRVGKKVQELERLLAESTASLARREDSLRLHSELDEVKTRLMQAENAVGFYAMGSLVKYYMLHADKDCPRNCSQME